MKIGEASTASGVSQRMIRHYEKIGLIAPAARSDSGYRDYTSSDMHKLQFIGRARDLGFSIEEIGQLLELWEDKGRSSSDVKALALARSAELRKRELVLRDMRRSLEHLAASCEGSDRPDCPILSKLEGAM